MTGHNRHIANASAKRPISELNQTPAFNAELIQKDKINRQSYFNPPENKITKT